MAVYIIVWRSSRVVEDKSSFLKYEKNVLQNWSQFYKIFFPIKNTHSIYYHSAVILGHKYTNISIKSNVLDNHFLS